MTTVATVAFWILFAPALVYVFAVGVNLFLTEITADRRDPDLRIFDGVRPSDERKDFR